MEQEEERLFSPKTVIRLQKL